jgi:hypothetical protein
VATSPGRASDVDELLFVDTVELRWFARGRIAPEVVSWFTEGGRSGVLEERRDSYRIDGRSDIGVKRRFRETLELKIRLSIGEHLMVDSHLAGALEVWRKWSPADRLVTSGEDERWFDVHKTVTKRRFTADGHEIVLAAGERAFAGTGCDVEIAAVSVEGVEAWTLAFAAFGQGHDRTRAIIAAWKALTAESRHPERFEASLSRSAGYPEWLTQVIPTARVVGKRELAFPRTIPPCNVEVRPPSRSSPAWS